MAVFTGTTIEEAKEKAEVARGSLYRREGDHLTLLATIQAYMAEQSDRKSWCEKHFVSYRAMRAVMVSQRKYLDLTLKSDHHSGCPQTAEVLCDGFVEEESR